MISTILIFVKKKFLSLKYMDEWEKFNERSLPEKEEFYSNLNMRNTTNEDYIHGKRVFIDFEIKN